MILSVDVLGGFCALVLTQKECIALAQVTKAAALTPSTERNAMH
jgi:hypothetical protein